MPLPAQGSRSWTATRSAGTGSRLAEAGILRRYVLPISLGIVCAALGQVVALGMAGGGDGWVSPFFFSVPLWVLYPLLFFRAERLTRADGSDALLEIAVLAIAVVADVALIARSADVAELRAVHFLCRFGPGMVATWLTIWLGWQAGAVAILAARGWRAL